jgi:hypothetical protein
MALGGFASSALIAVVGGALAHFQYAPALRAAAVAGLTIGVLSVSGLVLACAFIVSETKLAIDNLAEEADAYSRSVAKRMPQH